ncbi:HAD-IA family hydrolase [Kineococcus sp. DHX-1]|uniref:HAD-IA family hydrolase n=1 Tax=Kineococcus sp. DHX-1 TaxID=3349638 RepID=UPI0036D23DA5
MERSLPQLPGVVVFDVGGVLSAQEGGVPEVAAALGVAADVLGPAYWRHRDGYDRGDDARTYWTAVLTDLGLTASDVEARIEAVDAVDAARWGAPTAASAELLAAVCASGTRTGILSNAPQSLAGVVRAAVWSRPLEHLVFSCDLRAAKPEPAAYAAVEAAFGVPGTDVVFLDDRPVNVEAARERGWRAHLWTGADDAWEALRAEVERG